MDVLYVEDDRINAVIMQKALSESCEVTLVYDGESALREINKKHYDVYLLDINLGHPESSGLELCQIIREINKGSEPVVAVTAYSAKEDKERFLASGFDYYFAKPIRFSRMIEFIKSLQKS